jgi:hypothetical protein
MRNEMETQERTQVFEITNGCICVETDQDTGEVVVDKDGDEVPSAYCFGCYDEEVENLDYCLVNEWREHHGIDKDTKLVVLGEGMFWTNVSGWTIAKNATAQAIVEAMDINTEWRIDFRLEDNELSAVRYSHDEPTGTGRFRFRPATDEELEYER